MFTVRKQLDANVRIPDMILRKASSICYHHAAAHDIYRLYAFVLKLGRMDSLCSDVA